jgi:DNA polymerase III delta prime subunit
MKLVDGDSVVVGKDRNNIAIVDGRDGNELRLRFPGSPPTFERRNRKDVTPVADLMAAARLGGTKYGDNHFSLTGKSMLRQLVSWFGYMADQRMRRSSLDSVVRQLERAGVGVHSSSWDADGTFSLAILSHVDGPPADRQALGGVALPEIFWPKAVGLNGDELRFLRALTESPPILCLLTLPEGEKTLAWFQPTWEGLIGWAYWSAQRFVRREDRSPEHPVNLCSADALNRYLKPSQIDTPGLNDCHNRLNLVTLEPNIDFGDLGRLRAVWPGPIFEFSPHWLAAGPDKAPEELSCLIRMLCLVGGKPIELAEGEAHALSPLQLLLWARDSAATILAAGTLGLGSVFAEATTKRFRGSTESSTALALKALTATWLKRADRAGPIEFEPTVEPPSDVDESPTRVDLLSKRAGVFEIETMYCSGPIEDFYHRKVFSRAQKNGPPFHLVVPNECLLWAGPYLSDIARRLAPNGKVLFPHAATSKGPDEVTDFGLIELDHGKRDLSSHSLLVAEPREAGTAPPPPPVDNAEEALKLTDIAGYGSIVNLIRNEVVWVEKNRRWLRGASRAGGILFFGPPGCGKSRLARAIAGELGHNQRLIGPSDLRGAYVGWGAIMIREQFDWLLGDPGRVLIIDEFDAVARSRREQGMISDEKADVNELLVQLDRSARNGRLVLATTNFVGSLDEAVLRSGRFSHFVPVPPPDTETAFKIVNYYLARLGTDREGKSIDEIRISLPPQEELRKLVAHQIQKRAGGTGMLCVADLEEVVSRTYRNVLRETLSSKTQPESIDVAITTNALKDCFATVTASISAESVDLFLAEAQKYSSAKVAEEIARQLGETRNRP